MATVTCKRLKGKATDWYPTFKLEVVFAPGESLGKIESEPLLGWLSKVKVLKDGTKKYAQRFTTLSSDNDESYFEHRQKEFLTAVGVKVKE